MIKIPLTRGQFALIDDEDLSLISQYQWYANKGGGRHRKYYARAAQKRDSRWTIALMHRVIMNAQPHQLIDHIDGNGLNNQRNNLRFANQSQNNANGQKRLSNTSSRYKGVYWENGRWRARIRVNGRKIHAAYSNSEEEAALAYDGKAREFFGEFARTNF